MPQLVQSRSNRQCNLMKRCGIGGFAKSRSKFLLFEELFDLAFREQSRTRVHDARKNRRIVEMKNKGNSFWFSGLLRIARNLRDFIDANGREPSEPAEPVKITSKSRRVESTARLQRELGCHCCRRNVPQADELQRIKNGS